MSDSKEIEPSGKFVFEGIQEGTGDQRRVIEFNPPLVINFTILEKIDEITGEENYEEDAPVMGFGNFDFGLQMSTPLDEVNNGLVKGYEGLTPESDLVDIFLKTLVYDLIHTFFEDPVDDETYSHYHWALLGNLRHRVILKDYSISKKEIDF